LFLPARSANEIADILPARDARYLDTFGRGRSAAPYQGRDAYVLGQTTGILTCWPHFAELTSAAARRPRNSAKVSWDLLGFCNGRGRLGSSAGAMVKRGGRRMKAIAVGKGRENCIMRAAWIGW
jgi:hypothetical protein